MSDVYTENGCYEHSVCMNEDCPVRTEDRGYEFYPEPRQVMHIALNRSQNGISNLVEDSYALQKPTASFV